MALSADLCSKLVGLSGAVDLASAVLRELRGLQQSEVKIRNSSLVLRTVRRSGVAAVPLRPINSSLFIEDTDEYAKTATTFIHLLRELRDAEGDLPAAKLRSVQRSKLVGKSLYTTVQAIGLGMDVLVPTNQSRKNFGTRFEEVVEAVFDELGLGHSPVNLALPYTPEAGGTDAIFRNQVDLVVSSEAPISSRSDYLDPDEVVVSMKTSSKDRFAKIFLDKEVLRSVTDQDIPVMALFHNDVQRSGTDRVSVTFVAGNFSAYVESFGPLNGVYYIDPPPHISRRPWSKYLKTFDDLILADLWQLVFT